MLTELQQYLRLAASRGRTTSRVGPFLVTLQEDTTHPFLNYAIPDDDAEPAPEEVAALVAAFRERQRVPRLEYLEPTAPAVLEAVRSAGFVLEARLRAMTATEAVALPEPPGYALAAPAADADRAAMLAVQNAAFGEPGEPSAEHVERSKGAEAAGGIVLAVREQATGTIVGGGGATPSAGSGFTEITGVAVAEDHRGRGLGAALTAELTRRALSAGAGTAFLTPGDDGAARVYERAGFASVGRMLHARLE